MLSRQQLAAQICKQGRCKIPLRQVIALVLIVQLSTQLAQQLADRLQEASQQLSGGANLGEQCTSELRAANRWAPGQQVVRRLAGLQLFGQVAASEVDLDAFGATAQESSPAESLDVEDDGEEEDEDELNASASSEQPDGDPDESYDDDNIDG